MVDFIRFLCGAASASGPGLRVSSTPRQICRGYGDACVSGNWSAGSRVLQRIARMRAGPPFRRRFSLAPTCNCRCNAKGSNRSPDSGCSQCDPITAYDMCASDLVELQETPALGGSDCIIFVCFTVAATLGTGEHYFVDLIVAFPFSLMIQALCSYSAPFRDSERRTCCFFGALVTLIWLALLSFSTHLFWVSPIIPWSMAVATVSSSVLLWDRLLRTEPRPLHTLAAESGSARRFRDGERSASPIALRGQ